jgi:hypothetical protein
VLAKLAAISRHQLANRRRGAWSAAYVKDPSSENVLPDR